MVWRRPGDKPLSEPMVVSLLTHICVARPEWVKTENILQNKTKSREQYIYTLMYVLPWHWSCFLACHAPWWRHQVETFSALLALCEGNELPSQRPVTRSFGVFFDLRLNKRLSKRPIHRWFETPSCPIWRHCDDHINSCEYFLRWLPGVGKHMMDPSVQARIILMKLTYRDPAYVFSEQIFLNLTTEI